jgi:divalent metal cation (Fe/Co/Zn/Cd) transporter
VEAGSRLALSTPERPALVQRARLLAWAGIGWHFVEFAIAVAAGIAASSIALVAFGIDSLIESLAGFVVVWRFAERRTDPHAAERQAQKLIAASFFVLAAYVSFEAVRTLAGGDRPEVSIVGLVLAAVSVPVMVVLARAKRRVGLDLDSGATVSESVQNLLCSYLSVAVLLGLGANAAFGWWWADPVAALVIAAIALREGFEGWRAESQDCC